MSKLGNQHHSWSPLGLSGDTEPLVQHALEAFGSEEKAWRWLERANPLFDGNSPIENLRTDRSRYELVEERTKIEPGDFGSAASRMKNCLTMRRSEPATGGTGKEFRRHPAQRRAAFT